MTPPWASQARALRSQGLSLRAIARALEMADDRNLRKFARAEGWTRLPHVPEGEDRRFARSGDEATAEVRVPRLVRTEAEALEASAVDLTQWEVTALEIRHYPIPMGDGVVTQGTYIKVGCKRRTAPPLPEMVDALVAGALKARGVRPAVPVRAPVNVANGLAQCLVVADPHFGKLCWHKGTGDADYDLDIAERLVLGAATDLMERGGAVEKRYITFLGDVFHFDTLAGTTTGGTAVDRDSRVAKMLQVGADVCASIVRRSALTAPTEVVVVPGNHDEVLSAALQRILVAEFRADPSVTVDDTHTRRKVRLWGRTLLGFNHGDKRKKELAANLAVEHPQLWGMSGYREIHTGHLHSEGERYEGTLTHAGVIVRTHRSIAPPDQWHADEGYIGAARGMSAWVYHRAGGLVGMQMHDPALAAA